MIESIFPSVSSIVTITSIGIFFGLVLSFAKLKLSVEKDPRYEGILDALPGANCGSCGQPGCSGYAMKIIEGSVKINLCPAGGSETIEKISSIMQIEADVLNPRTARIQCQGGIKEAFSEFVYDGPKSCLAAEQIMGGFKACQYGCLGLGDCVRSCSFDAIEIGNNGLPIVDKGNCTGCGNCVTECPRNIICLVDEKFDVHVICKNKDKASVMKKACSVGCISCKKCEKVCKEVFKDNSEIETAIEIKDFLAIIDYDKCVNCGKCADACPKNVIEFTKEPALV